VELYDRHVLLVLRLEFPDSGEYRGVDEIGSYMRELLVDFADLRIVAEEFLEAGDSVVVRVHQQATGPESGAPVAMRYYQLWTFRGPSVIRIESVMDRDDALDAVGLRG
jgi:ketosteroid isomerase-like protein